MNNNMRVKYACYTVNVIMAVVTNLSPLLFMTFRSLYSISYSLLGTLVLIFFCTQLGIDLIFSFFSHKFNIQKTVRVLPWLTFVVDHNYLYDACRYADKSVKGMNLECTDENNWFKSEFDEFYALLSDGKMPYSYEDLISSVFVMNAIERSMKSGNEEKVSTFSV